MAFGKDRGQLANIPGFGGTFIQKAKTAARRPPRSSGGTFHWKGNYRPSDNSHDIIRLVRGDYVQQVTHDGRTIIEDTFPFFMFREHTSKAGGRVRTTICSGGALWANRELRSPCPSCEVFWEDVTERKAKKARGDNTKGPNRIGCRDQFAFTVFDYSIYFEMPDTDANGQLRMNPSTNAPYTSWVKGNPNDPQFSGRPWKQGHLAPWAMGQTYKDTLVEWAKQIGKSCSSCGTRDSIVCVMKICPNCGQFIYDPSSTTLSEEQREQIDNYPFTCSHCGQTGYVAESLECNNPGCSSPKRATLFDVDLEVQRLGTAGQQTFLQVFNYSEPRPIQIQDPEVLKGIKALDLAKKFAPTPPEKQLTIHGLQSAPPAMQQPVMSAPPMPPGMTYPAMAAPPAVTPPGAPAHVQVAPMAFQQGTPPAMPPMSRPAQVQLPQMMAPPTAPSGPPVILGQPGGPQTVPQGLSNMPASPYPPVQPIAGTPKEG